MNICLHFFCLAINLKLYRMIPILTIHIWVKCNNVTRPKTSLEEDLELGEITTEQLKLLNSTLNDCLFKEISKNYPKNKQINPGCFSPVVENKLVPQKRDHFKMTFHLKKTIEKLKGYRSVLGGGCLQLASIRSHGFGSLMVSEAFARR